MQLLNAFYDSVAYSIGPVMVYTAMFLFAIEMIYVMIKYLPERKDS